MTDRVPTLFDEAGGVADAAAPSEVGGLDLATVTGWAVPLDGTIVVGEWDFTPKPATKKRPPEPEGVRYRKLFDALHALLDRYPHVRGFAIEQPFSKSRRGSEVLSGLIAAAEIVFETRGIEYVFVDASTLKKFGRIASAEVKAAKGEEKEAMRLVAAAHLGVTLTDNEADAWWCRRWYLDSIGR